jgi:WD40 repeat protein
MRAAQTQSMPEPTAVTMAWHPDGAVLVAVPGVDNDVVLYERLSWDVASVLKGEHTAPVHLVAFSRIYGASCVEAF